jgi:hypothetical protein
MLYTDRHRLVRLLIEKALSNRSQASRALYHSVLALASYHRGDGMLEVDRSKRAAIRDLYTHTDMTIDDGVDHIAANMLLCVLEVLVVPNPTNHNVLTHYRCSKHTKTTPAGSATSTA